MQQLEPELNNFYAGFHVNIKLYNAGRHCETGVAGGLLLLWLQIFT